MPKLTEGIALSIASTVTDYTMERLEQHVEAHPLRYGGRELSEDAYVELRERIGSELLLLLHEIEIPPK